MPELCNECQMTRRHRSDCKSALGAQPVTRDSTQPVNHVLRALEPLPDLSQIVAQAWWRIPQVPAPYQAHLAFRGENETTFEGAIGVYVPNTHRATEIEFVITRRSIERLDVDGTAEHLADLLEYALRRIEEKGINGT